MKFGRLHVAGALIMLAWLASLGWLVQRQYFSTRLPAGTTASDRLAPGSRFYAVFADGRQVGTASLTADTMPDGARISQRLDIGLRGTLESQFQTVVLSPALALRSWSATMTGRAPPIIVAGKRDSTGRFEASLTERGELTRTLAMEPGGALPLFAAALKASLGLRTRTADSLTLHILDPFSGGVSVIAVRRVPAPGPMIVTDSARLDPATGRWVEALADTIEAQMLVQVGSAHPVRLWVDREGYPVRAELADGLVLQRTAFEIAHLNFRNGFPASQPDPGGKRSPARYADVPLPGDTAGGLFFPAADPELAPIVSRAFASAATRADSVAGLARWIARHVRGDTTTDDAVAAATSGRASPVGRARLYVAVLRRQGIPARLATGASAAGGQPSLTLMPQAFTDRWVTADFAHGQVSVDSITRILAPRTGGLWFGYQALSTALGNTTP